MKDKLFKKLLKSIDGAREIRSGKRKLSHASFLRRIEAAHQSLRAGRGTRIEDVKW